MQRGAGVEPVHGDAAADEVPAQRRMVESGRRVGGVDERWLEPGGRELVDHGGEPGGLRTSERVAGLVGHRAVGPDALESERRVRDDLGCPPQRLVGRHTDAVHPGIDLEVHGERHAAGGRCLPQAADRL